MIIRLLRNIYLFISQSTLDCIALCVLIIYKSHFTKTYFWRLIFIFYLSICNTLIKILLIYIKSIRISSLFVHININICIKLYIFAHFLVEVSFIFLWTEQKYSKHVAIKVVLFTLLRYSSVLPTFQIESSEQTILHWTILHKFPACIAAWKHFMLIIIKILSLF